MEKIDMLIDTVEELFLTGVTMEHDEEELLELLDDVDWYNLLQALILSAKPVYEFEAAGDGYPSLEYKSKNLFGQNAVCLDEEIISPKEGETAPQVHVYSRELWILEDFTFAVTSCFRVQIGKTTCRAEYRTIKSYDWRESGMDVDFCCVADALVNLANDVKKHGYPLIEV